MARIIILGASGSGRTTQALHLQSLLNIPVISTSEILRLEMATATDLGIEVKKFINAGEFVPDMLMIELMRLRLQKEDTQKGWILEGYPRTSFQAEELDFLLEELEIINPDYIITFGNESYDKIQYLLKESQRAPSVIPLMHPSPRNFGSKRNDYFLSHNIDITKFKNN